MMHRNCIVFIIVTIGIPLAGLMAYFSLNYSGFCFAQMRYLSNEEKFQSVFEAYIKNKKTEGTDNMKEKSHTSTEDKTFEEYVKKNPDCCKINPGGPYDLPPPSFLDRITGYNSGDVIVMDFKKTYLDKNGKQKLKEYQAQYVMQNCGKIKWRNYFVKKIDNIGE